MTEDRRLRIQSGESEVSFARVVGATTSASTVGTIPVFLLGAMAPFVRTELGLSQTQLGISVSAFWLFMALGGVAGGHLSQRLGATVATRLGVTGSMLAMVLASLAGSWWILIVAMAIAGLFNSLSQPAVDLALFAGVERSRLSLAFGIKQTALPGAAVISGLAVPLLANSIGWRPSFLIGVVVGLPALILMPRLVYRHVDSTGRATDPNERLQGISRFAIAFGIAMMAVSAMGAFYVESAVSHGFSSDTAGLFLAAGSLCGVVGRFVFAWRLGSITRPLIAASIIMIVGGTGVLCFAFATAGWALLLATLVALGAGWGWNGLLTFAVVSLYPQAPARSSGYLVLGAASGGVIGPTVFGLIAQHAGFSLAWIVASGCFLGAATILQIRRRPGLRKSSAAATP
ncbi:MAG: MFS transporter [Actinomycetes bacterium]